MKLKKVLKRTNIANFSGPLEGLEAIPPINNRGELGLIIGMSQFTYEITDRPVRTEIVGIFDASTRTFDPINNLDKVIGHKLTLRIDKKRDKFFVKHASERYVLAEEAYTWQRHGNLYIGLCFKGIPIIVEMSLVVDLFNVYNAAPHENLAIMVRRFIDPFDMAMATSLANAQMLLFSEFRQQLSFSHNTNIQN